MCLARIFINKEKGDYKVDVISLVRVQDTEKGSQKNIQKIQANKK